MLWFNCEFKIETGNEKHKTKRPADSRFYYFKTKYCVCSLFKRGKGTYIKTTLEVYNVKITLEVYNVKITLEVYNVKTTLEVYTVKTLEVFVIKYSLEVICL